jgi:hypothetical protein
VPQRLAVLHGTGAPDVRAPWRAAMRRALTNVIEMRLNRATLDESQTQPLLLILGAIGSNRGTQRYSSLMQ